MKELLGQISVLNDRIIELRGKEPHSWIFDVLELQMKIDEVLAEMNEKEKEKEKEEASIPKEPKDNTMLIKDKDWQKIIEKLIYPQPLKV